MDPSIQQIIVRPIAADQAPGFFDGVEIEVKQPNGRHIAFSIGTNEARHLAAALLVAVGTPDERN